MEKQKYFNSFIKSVLFIFLLFSNAVSEVIQLKAHKQIAQKIAQKIWKSADISEPIPYYGLNDQIIMYTYNICRSGSFHKPTVDNRSSEYGNEDYSFMCISARSEEEPLLEYAERLSDDIILKEKLDELAIQKLGTDAIILRRYYIDAGDKWLLYSNGTDSLYIKMYLPYTVYSSSEFKLNVADKWRKFIENIRQNYPSMYKQEIIENKKSWDRLQEGETHDSKEIEKMIDHWEEMPFYDWHKGCTPTSAAMCLGYFDDLSLYPKHDYFGNIVSYCFQEYDNVEDETDYNVPDIINSLADYMDTESNGKTMLWNADDGIIQLVKEKGYDCDASWHGCGSADATAKDDIRNAIGKHRPCIVNSSNHSYAAYGYRYRDDGDKLWVFVHNTWDNIIPHKLYVKWFYSTICMNPKSPGIGSVRLTSPVGSQEYNSDSGGVEIVINQTFNITWNTNVEIYGQGQVQIHHMYLDTTDQFKTYLMATVPNNGLYEWFVAPSTPHSSADNRIYIRLLDEEGNIIAQDGSYGPFKFADTYNNIREIFSFPIFTAERDFEHFLRHNGPFGSWGIIGLRTEKDFSGYTLRVYNNPTMEFLEEEDTIPYIVDGPDQQRTGFIVYSPDDISDCPKMAGIQVSTSSKKRFWIQGRTSSKELGFGVNQITWQRTDDIVQIYELPMQLSHFSSQDTIQILLHVNNDADMGLALYSHMTTYKYDNRNTPKNLSLYADDGGCGEDEVLNVVINKNVFPFDDTYGLVVFSKSDSALFPEDIQLDIFPLNQTVYSSSVELGLQSALFAINGTEITLNQLSAQKDLVAAVFDMNNDSYWSAFALSQNESAMMVSYDTLSAVDCLYPFLKFFVFNFAGIQETNIPYIKLKRHYGSGGTVTGVGIQDQILQVGNNGPFTLNDNNKFKMWKLEIPEEYHTVSILQVDISLEKFSGYGENIGLIPLDQEDDIYVFSTGDIASVLTLSNVYRYVGKSKDLLIVSWLNRSQSVEYSLNISLTALTDISERNQTISDFELFNAYPNPFNSSTTISYNIPKPCEIIITLFDINGREIRKLRFNNKAAGTHNFVLNAVNSDNEPLSSGVYFVELQAEHYKAIKKLIFIR